MPGTPGSLVDAVAELIDHLETSGLDYALGGAIAYSAWAEPRATRDIDLNLWVSRPELDHTFDVLSAAGVSIDRDAARQAADERGMFVGYHGEYRVDVFVPSVPFYAEALQRRVRAGVAGRHTWVLSPETLAVFKMLFFRPRDVADVQRLLAIQHGKIATAFVREWLVKMVGDGDERVREWDRLVAVR
ncbi:nucleotidyltransferase family protein [Candidatus Binatia bacterium]|nr:nucleotidyltransferase family protein [Candidatus Binatia bacterium]